MGHKITGLRMVLEDGVAHSVDSSENAFKAAAMGAMRSCECYLTSACMVVTLSVCLCHTLLVIIDSKAMN